MLPNRIDQDSIERREYQHAIYRAVKDQNALVVLPTGLGKTIIGAFVVAHRLQQGSVLFLAPTKPLCEQHAGLLREVLTTPDDAIELITGETHGPEAREAAWTGDYFVAVATPQTVANDIEAGRVPVDGISLIVFDEAHRAVGEYAYVTVADAYLEHAQSPQTLGLTASPGTEFERLVEVAANLRLEAVEFRTEFSEDVEPYVGEFRFEWREVEKPPAVERAEAHLNDLLAEHIDELASYTKQAQNLQAETAPKMAFIDIQNRFQQRLQTGGGGYLYHAVTLAAAALKLTHLKTLLTTQGPQAAVRYLGDLVEEDSKAAKRLLDSDEIAAVEDILGDGVDNRKLAVTEEILIDHFSGDGGPVMVFAEYRHTVDLLVEELTELDGVTPERFVGQAGEGMSQDEQKETLDRFGAGEFNTLVSTAIGEEGIDVPATALVVFFEPVPSTIRLIQRRGRTARDGRPGRAVVLLMKGSVDEAAYWKAIHGESDMYAHVERLKDELDGGRTGQQLLRVHGTMSQSNLGRF